MIAAGAVAAMALLSNSPLRSPTLAARPDRPAEAKPSEQQEEASATSASLPVAVTTSDSATTEVQSVAVASPSAQPVGGEFQFKPTVTDGEQPASSAPPAGSSPAPTPSPTPSSPSPAGDFKPAGLVQAEQFEKAVLDLYAAETLLSKKEYPALRKLFAERFAREHEGEIKQGLGDDFEAMIAWFAEHPSIQEEPKCCGCSTNCEKRFPKRSCRMPTWRSPRLWSGTTKGAASMATKAKPARARRSCRRRWRGPSTTSAISSPQRT
jgi:hypothetical protein